MYRSKKLDESGQGKFFQNLDILKPCFLIEVILVPFPFHGSRVYITCMIIHFTVFISVLSQNKAMQGRHSIFDMYGRVNPPRHFVVDNRNYIPSSLLMEQSPYQISAHGSSRYRKKTAKWRNQL